MNPDQQTHLLIGTLVAAVIVVVGYGLFQALEPAPAPVVPPIAQEAPPAAAPAPAPGMPVLRIQTDNPVTANTSGHQASLSADSDVSCEWSIQGGTFQGDIGGTAVTWTAGAGTETILTCKGTNAAGKTSTVVLRVTLSQPPTISRFEAAPLVITEGSAAKLSWTVDNIQKLTLEPGGQDLTKNAGAPLEVKPGKTTTYTLTATNSTGITVTRELKLKVVPPPEIATLRAEPVAGSITAFTVIGEFKAGKAELKNGSQVVANSEASPLRIQVADLKAGSALVLTVTNEAGTYVASSLNFTTIKK